VKHAISWQVSESEGFETSWIDLGDDSLQARGRAVGTIPELYWVTYTLDTGADFITRRLRVSVERASGSAELDLRRDEDGVWTGNGAPIPDVEGALDCDLGLCPLTNTMPVLRHRLHVTPGESELLMAWVSVPDLVVQPSVQTYTTLAMTPQGAYIRFAAGDFHSDIEVDASGLVVEYPGMATRL
jgi:uncharacterized protein